MNDAIGYSEATYTREQILLLAELWKINGQSFSATLAVALDMKIFPEPVNPVFIVEFLERIQKAIENGQEIWPLPL